MKIKTLTFLIETVEGEKIARLSFPDSERTITMDEIDNICQDSATVLDSVQADPNGIIVIKSVCYSTPSECLSGLAKAALGERN